MQCMCRLCPAHGEDRLRRGLLLIKAQGLREAAILISHRIPGLNWYVLVLSRMLWHNPRSFLISPRLFVVYRLHYPYPMPKLPVIFTAIHKSLLMIIRHVFHYNLR